jgi:HK97 gp10 family phage protein
MKTLKDLAGLYKTLAQTNLTTGPTKAYKTGNLYNQIGSRNSADSMTSTPSKGKFVLTLNYAPSDATYGKFVEEGTQYMDARPFAEKAANDPKLKLEIDSFVNGKVSEILVDKVALMTKEMRRAGFKVS